MCNFKGLYQCMNKIPYFRLKPPRLKFDFNSTNSNIQTMSMLRNEYAYCSLFLFSGWIRDSAGRIELLHAWSFGEINC